MNDELILEKVFSRIKDYIKADLVSEKKVVDFKSPDELRELIRFAVPQTGVSEPEFIELVDQYLNYSVRTGSKQFFNQLYAGFNIPAFIGELCTILSNTSMYTYEVAPVATVIETEMIKLMNDYVGYHNGEGTFLSGGSNANMIAMFSARNQLLPEVRTEGYDNKSKLTVLINEQAHYSFETAANLLGLGANNVIKVKSDAEGRLIPEALESEILASKARGERPFFVAATCATTLLGAYDPLDQMSEICQRHGLWLHADGSFGGSLILSDKHRNLMKGIEKTDSFSWNPHKLMNVPLVCSTLLVKKRGTLERNITDVNTDYLFHDIDQIEDLGKKSIQCGRRVDAVKLWFAWQYFGLRGYQQRLDNLIDMARYAEQRVLQLNSLQLVSPRQSFAVCFRYVPYSDEINNTEQQIDQLNFLIRESLRKNGQSLVNFGYLNNRLVIRLVVSNGELEKKDIDCFFESLVTVGKHLSSTNTE